jgi:signal transduction histidine kinase
MRHRIRALGGTFDISGSPGAGLLDIRIPVSRAVRTLPEEEASDSAR